MQLQLNIKDEDLNKEIKKLVDGQLKSLVRSEISKVIKAEVELKMKHIDKDRINELVNAELKSQIRSAVNPNYGTSPIKKEITAQIKKGVTDAMKKNQDSIEKIVGTTIDNRLRKVLTGLG